MAQRITFADGHYWTGSETGHLWQLVPMAMSWRATTSRGNFDMLPFYSTIVSSSMFNMPQQARFRPTI